MQLLEMSHTSTANHLEDCSERVQCMEHICLQDRQASPFGWLDNDNQLAIMIATQSRCCVSNANSVQCDAGAS